MKTRKIYIAAKYAQRFALREVAAKLQAAGYEITGGWIWDDEAAGDNIQYHAIRDVEDVRRADTLVFIGEPQASENRGGGRWFEFGYAHALGHRTIAVLDLDPRKGGHDHLPPGHESVFTALPDVELMTSWDELVERLAEEASR
jgi:nucleoside 2-deoxyribosyltransferase